MKNLRKVLALLLVAAMVAAMAGCSGGDSGSSSATESSAVESSSEAESSAEESSEESSESSEESSAGESTDGTTPRNETLYLSGIQWGKPNDMNPMSTNSNCFYMSQGDLAREYVWETLYMYNPLDAKLYPLLADGDYEWNDDQTELTVKIKPAAKWSDGTQVTADDVAYTFECQVKYQTNGGIDYAQYIDTVEAVDESTVVFKAKTDNLNPLKILEYIPKMFVMQKAYLQSMEEETGEDAEAMKTATFWDAPHTGPYSMYYYSEEKVVIERDDNYWGQDASMWGKLPAPKYIAHNIFSDNAAGDTALKNGEVDVSQQYTANVNKLWEEDGLPISTYYSDAPYHLSATMPSMYFNTTKEGLDQKAVRQAIAYAVDYDQIIATAMTNQSPSFSDMPRSLFNPSDPEREIQANFQDDLADLQWTGKEYDRANKVLDDAGIVDTDGDGIREYNGTNLHFTVECPKGWSDWNAACDLVADCGQYIGIGLETYYPESTVWTEDIQTANYDLAMSSPAGFSISNPWTRCYELMYGFGGSFPERVSLNYSRWYNEEADAVLADIPTQTDEAKLIEDYKTLNMLYLEEVPSFALMYRPALFCTYNESVWTGFPEEGDGTNIPPTICSDGYGIAALYQIHLVDEE